jgi:hypothetical protein
MPYQDKDGNWRLMVVPRIGRMLSKSKKNIRMDWDKSMSVGKGNKDTSYRIPHQIKEWVPASSLNVDEIIKAHKDRGSWYITNYDAIDIKKLRTIQWNPDADIKIYRASPVHELNSWDWITTSKVYAWDIKKQNWGKVYEYTVKAWNLVYPKDISELPSLARFSAFKYVPNK